MPLTFTAAPSSRITKSKPNKKPSFNRAVSSPFQNLQTRKPVNRPRSKPATTYPDDGDIWEDELEDLGLVKTLATDLRLRDVVQTMKYTRSHMFDELPERSGMNSTRVAEVLNFRKSLPPIVPNVHVHALVNSPTAVEREIAELVSAGLIRKVVVPGRGVGGSSISDALVLVEEWEELIQNCRGLEQDLIDDYIKVLKTKTSTRTVPKGTFTVDHATTLMRAGFLTTASNSFHSANVFLRPDSASSGTMTSIANVARSASGSMDAVGGHSAVLSAGGNGSSGLGPNSSSRSSNGVRDIRELQLALPNTGAFLKLLTEARSHMLQILSKSRYKEIPLYLLREKWDGGIAASEQAVQQSRQRGVIEVLPGRTQKWKKFYGLRFDWVLEECLGAGLIEVFETGSVGRGVRAV
jgi:hypothetical protein